MTSLSVFVPASQATRKNSSDAQKSLVDKLFKNSTEAEVFLSLLLDNLTLECGETVICLAGTPTPA